MPKLSPATKRLTHIRGLIQQALGFRSQPEIYLLDADGNLLQMWVGYTSEQDFEEVFAKYVQ